jgi:hypothetical protein
MIEAAAYGVGFADGEVLGEIVEVGVPGVGVPLGAPEPPGLGDGDGPQMMMGSGAYLVCR